LDEHYRRQESQEVRPFATREKVELVWTHYIPAAVTGVATVACIVGANRIGNKRAAAMAAAYTIVERNFSEYRDKVVERTSKLKEQKIHDEIAQDNVTRHPPNDREVIITDTGDVLCCDAFTRRYFVSSMEKLKKGQNDLNYQLLNDSYASLSDFYNLIGLPTTSYSDEVGWKADKLLELEFSTTMTDDQRPCISMDFNTVPVRDYYRMG
jgi:hypothetical protein